MAKFRNEGLKNKLDNLKPKENLKAAITVPKPDTKNISGKKAYTQDKWLKLLTMLNTLKLESQFYRSENETMKELQVLVEDCAKTDLYFTAQCIVYSRCVGEGMRSINHLAATYLAKYIAGNDWSKRFYSLWDKKNQKGGCVFRADDIAEMLAVYTAINSVSLSNSMKKGFKDAIERMDSYTLLKYKSALIDVINLVHPSPKKSKAVVEYNGEKISTITAIMKGYSVSADTWEVAQSDAGQQVAKAVKEGKLDKKEAEKVLQEAKSDNWKSLLSDEKLGILAAIRNLRNILINKPDSDTINKLCELISDGKEILKGKIMPYQIDLANEVMCAEFDDSNSRKISQALVKGYEAALPNLSELLVGNNLVIVDFSGSMTTAIKDPNRKLNYRSSCADKAALIAATIAKSTNADVIRFGDNAEYVKYNSNADVFTIAKQLFKSMGCTNLEAAWRLAANSGRKYDRVFILSDNECNRGNSYKGYQSYLTKVANPYVYSVDLAAYGTTQLAGEKVRFYYGFGYSMFEDIAASEFNANYHIEKVKKIVI